MRSRNKTARYIRKTPNVKGYVANFTTQNAPSVIVDGAFTKTKHGDTAKASMIQDPDVYDRFDLDASRSSAIFGKSTKVQPRSFYALMIIKA